MTARIELCSGIAKTESSEIVERVDQLESLGADVIELNPGPQSLISEIPTPDYELSRLVPVLRKLASRSAKPISVVTANEETAQRAVGLGASIVHDMTGLAFDKRLAAAVNETDAALILGHFRGTPSQWSRLEPLTRLAKTLSRDLRASLLRAHKAGLERQRIVLDPGLEHGKRGKENFDLLRCLGSLAPPGQGIQANLAGKRFLVESVRASRDERRAALAVAATLALESGAHMLTVERPEAVLAAVAVVDRIYREDEKSDLLAD